ncbi:MAG TPA: GNAT family N-acetyltransferase [Puia sp.]
MSTKPTPLFKASEGFVPSSLNGGDLYTSFLSQEIRHGIVYSVRAFDPATDIPILHGWLNPGCGGALPADGLTASWLSMIGSDSIRPFMGLLNGTPACQVELYKARQHTLSLYYKDSPDDYGLHWQAAPGIERDQMTGLLRTCLEFFFSFSEVGRVLAEADIADTWDNELFRKAGFLLLQKIAVPYQPSNLYVCTRDRLRKVLFHS